MEVKELLEQGFRRIALPEGERQIKGAYIGDLLSWVMAHCSADAAWITIMSNANVIAVAALADPACVILSEGVKLPDDMIRLAEEKGVNILSSPLPSYETAVRLSGLLL